MIDPHEQAPSFASQPLPLTLDVRVWVLERLVLELTKHVMPAAELPPGAVMAIEELKARHPDV